MRSVHLLGSGLVVGALALGGMLAVMTFRWQQDTFPEKGAVVAEAVSQPAATGTSASGDTAKGKALFDAKCASCHTIGGGKRGGPDLKGVTAQRSHDWLVEFIVAPDKLIASGDQTAAQLVKEYGMPMPNMGLSKEEAEAVLAYLATPKGGSAAPAKTAPAPAAPATAPTSAPKAEAPAKAAAPAASAPASAAGQGSSQGQAAFTQKCASCHSIGGGRLAGPDLKGVTEQRSQDWLIRMIVEPDKLIASGDATAAQLVKEYGMPMPNLGVPKAEAEAIVSYLKGQSGAASSGGQAAPATLPLGDPAVGRALFTGEKAMANGGPSCISCHNAAGTGALGGGNWGLDLTKAQSKTGTAGLVSMMKSPPFPGMAEAFASRPLTDSEVSDLAAFFVEVDGQQAGGSPDITFPLIGLVAAAALVLLAQLTWRGRARGVRKQLVAGKRG